MTLYVNEPPSLKHLHTLTQLQIIAAAALCSYPPHSISSCAQGRSIACGFECTDGFSPSPLNNPTTCVCEAPLFNCNGQCIAAASCPSIVVPDKKKRWVGSGVCAEMGPEWAACGVFGGGARAWECIDTANNLESCKYLLRKFCMVSVRKQLTYFAFI
jgi:hypothetical protein